MSKQQEMTFWEHLDELRSILLRIIAVWIVVLFATIIVMPHIFDSVILAPCSSNFILYRWLDQISRFLPQMPQFVADNTEISLINIQLTSQFVTHITTSMWLSLLLVFPYILYQIWTFVSPALYSHEKSNVKFTFGVGNLMFYLGVTIGYLIVFPLTLRFLANYQVSDLIPNTISLDSYMSNFFTLTMAMGVVFELPLLCKLLSSMGLIDRSFFTIYRRHAIIAILLLAAIITPSGDPFTLIVVFIPIYIVYEISALFVSPHKKQS